MNPADQYYKTHLMIPKTASPINANETSPAESSFKFQNKNISLLLLAVVDIQVRKQNLKWMNVEMVDQAGYAFLMRSNDCETDWTAQGLFCSPVQMRNIQLTVGLIIIGQWSQPVTITSLFYLPTYFSSTTGDHWIGLLRGWNLNHAAHRTCYAEGYRMEEL